MTDMKQIKYAGSYTIGGSYGLKFSVQKRPRWLTRKLLWWLLEIGWEDTP